ncbi:MAG: multidrug MFS transporter [Clostridia bacterium]|nr:multidrug MFS transporter [Clostridia bacterium]
MIFVTVGTHEQGFDRLIKEIDRLKEQKIINEDVIIQKGYTEYEPKYCETYKLIDYDKMQQYLSEARIVITHGGPASFVAPLAIGKTPIVVPRQKQFEEHVNDHQVDFVKQVVERNNSLIPVYDISELEEKIVKYEEIVSNMSGNYSSNNGKFVEELEKEIEKMFK